MGHACVQARQRTVHVQRVRGQGQLAHVRTSSAMDVAWFVEATESIIDEWDWSGPPSDAPLEGVVTSASAMMLMPSVQLDAEVGGRTAAPSSSSSAHVES